MAAENGTPNQPPSLRGDSRKGSSKPKTPTALLQDDPVAKAKPGLTPRTSSEDLRRQAAELQASHTALRERERELAAIYENAPLMMMVVDGQRRVHKVNKLVATLAGIAASDLVGRRPGEALSCARALDDPLNCVESAKCAECLVRRTIKETLATGHSHYQVEVTVPILSQGRRQNSTFLLSSAALELYGQRMALVTLEDVTERKRAEEALHQSENELAAFFEDSPLGLLWMDPKGQIVRVNRAELELLGRSAEEVLGHPISQFHVEPETAEDILARLASGETVQHYRARLRHRGGSVKQVRIDANGLWEQERLVRSRWFVRDITRQVELEREILAVSEREQRRLGHDLHDDLCQQLAGIQFVSQTLASNLDARADAEAARAKEIAQAVQHAMAQTRELARGLSPVSLEADGLMAALSGLAERTQKVFRIQCHFRCEPPVFVPDHSVAIHLYRIAQEAVGNAIKHGKASVIEIRLAAADKNLRLGVSDNGIGIPRHLPRQRGLGLRFMQYRAGVIGGSLLVQREPTGGTSVVCTVTDGLRPPSAKGSP